MQNGKFSIVGKFRHLPVVENGEVIALLDIAKCLYDAIARMEKAAEKARNRVVGDPFKSGVEQGPQARSLSFWVIWIY